VAGQLGHLAHGGVLPAEHLRHHAPAGQPAGDRVGHRSCQENRGQDARAPARNRSHPRAHHHGRHGHGRREVADHHLGYGGHPHHEGRQGNRDQPDPGDRLLVGFRRPGRPRQRRPGLPGKPGNHDRQRQKGRKDLNEPNDQPAGHGPRVERDDLRRIALQIRGQIVASPGPPDQRYQHAAEGQDPGRLPRAVPEGRTQEEHADKSGSKQHPGLLADQHTEIGRQGQTQTEHPRPDETVAVRPIEKPGQKRELDRFGIDRERGRADQVRQEQQQAAGGERQGRRTGDALHQQVDCRHGGLHAEHGQEPVGDLGRVVQAQGRGVEGEDPGGEPAELGEAGVDRLPACGIGRGRQPGKVVVPEGQIAQRQDPRPVRWQEDPERQQVRADPPQPCAPAGAPL